MALWRSSFTTRPDTIQPTAKVHLRMPNSGPKSPCPALPSRKRPVRDFSCAWIAGISVPVTAILMPLSVASPRSERPNLSVRGSRRPGGFCPDSRDRIGSRGHLGRLRQPQSRLTQSLFRRRNLKWLR